MFNVDSDNEAVALIPIKINARQTRGASLKLVEKVHAKAKRNRQLQNESGSAAGKCLIIYICVFIYALSYTHIILLLFQFIIQIKAQHST